MILLIILSPKIKVGFTNSLMEAELFSEFQELLLPMPLSEFISKNMLKLMEIYGLIPIKLLKMEISRKKISPEE